jgi:hypothetical protein
MIPTITRMSSVTFPRLCSFVVQPPVGDRWWPLVLGTVLTQSSSDGPGLWSMNDVLTTLGYVVQVTETGAGDR